MKQECRFNRAFLYMPGKNRGRPSLSDALRRFVWRESGYRCAMPSCRSPGVEVHHIVPWREAIFRCGKPHPADDLIALCPACHARADDEDITRAELYEIKSGFLARQKITGFEQPPWLDAVTSADVEFLLHLREWHRAFVYRGRSAQYRDYLQELKHYLKKTERLHSIKGIGVLSALGGVLRRQGSKQFQAAHNALRTAEALAQDIVNTNAVSGLLGRIRYDLGYISFLRNDYDGSVPLLDAGIETDRNAGNEIGRRITGSVKMLVDARKTGHFNLQQMRDNLAAFANIEHPDAARWVINCQIHLAEFCLQESNNPETALDYLQKASRGYDHLGLVTGRAKLLLLFGSAFAETCEMDKALSALSAALASYRELGPK